MTRAQFMRDRDGVVHELLLNAYVGGESYWAWPSGHVDARMRQAEPDPEATAPTCLVCIHEHANLPEHVRDRMLAFKDMIVR